MTTHSVESEFEVVEERERAPLTPEMEARRKAALRHVRKFGDPVLRAKAIPVTNFGVDLEREVAQMEKIMIDAIGCGLAATQVGILHRLLIYKLGEEAELVVLVNPEITWSGEETDIAEEGCLSLPGVVLDIERSLAIKVKALGVSGEPLELELEGLDARVVQHEVDHLDGVLTLDRAEKSERKEALRILRLGAAS